MNALKTSDLSDSNWLKLVTVDFNNYWSLGKVLLKDLFRDRYFFIVYINDLCCFTNSDCQTKVFDNFNIY